MQSVWRCLVNFNHALGFKCSFGATFHGGLKFLLCGMLGPGPRGCGDGMEVVRMQQEWFGSEELLGCSEGDELSSRNVMQEG